MHASDCVESAEVKGEVKQLVKVGRKGTKLGI